MNDVDVDDFIEPEADVEDSIMNGAKNIKGKKTDTSKKS